MHTNLFHVTMEISVHSVPRYTADIVGKFDNLVYYLVMHTHMKPDRTVDHFSASDQDVTIAYMHAHPDTHANTHTYTHTHTQSHTHTHMHARTHTHTPYVRHLSCVDQV